VNKIHRGPDETPWEFEQRAAVDSRTKLIHQYEINNEIKNLMNAFFPKIAKRNTESKTYLELILKVIVELRRRLSHDRTEQIKCEEQDCHHTNQSMQHTHLFDDLSKLFSKPKKVFQSLVALSIDNSYIPDVENNIFTEHQMQMLRHMKKAVKNLKYSDDKQYSILKCPNTGNESYSWMRVIIDKILQMSSESIKGKRDHLEFSKGKRAVQESQDQFTQMFLDKLFKKFVDELDLIDETVSKKTDDR